jgi:Nickel responsive protein SCO4226-like
MAVFMVERELKGITMAQLAAAQKRAIATAQKFTDDGKAVRYIRSTFLPGEDRSMCLFEAADANTVKDLNQDAEIPFVRIVEALDLTP